MGVTAISTRHSAQNQVTVECFATRFHTFFDTRRHTEPRRVVRGIIEIEYFSHHYYTDDCITIVNSIIIIIIVYRRRTSHHVLFGVLFSVSTIEYAIFASSSLRINCVAVQLCGAFSSSAQQLLLLL